MPSGLMISSSDAQGGVNQSLPFTGFEHDPVRSHFERISNMFEGLSGSRSYLSRNALFHFEKSSFN